MVGARRQSARRCRVRCMFLLFGLGRAARRRMNPAATYAKPAEAGCQEYQPASAGLASQSGDSSPRAQACAATYVIPNEKMKRERPGWLGVRQDADERRRTRTIR